MLNYKDENGKSYSLVYLKTVHNQLSAIFNHAVRYYNIRENPCKKAGSMGKKIREMMFWNKEQYLKFAEVMMDKPLSFYAFEMLYWCGIQEGKLVALTRADFDFEKRTVTINKSYQRLNGQDLITTPKTEKSNRVITMSVPGRTCRATRSIREQYFTLHWKMTRAVCSAGCSVCLAWKGQALSTLLPVSR